MTARYDDAPPGYKWIFRPWITEQAFRFNERKDSDAGRFLKACAGIFGKGLKYVDLIGKGGEDLQPA